MKARVIKISGRVQGVGYRYFAFRYAQKLGLTGYAKNTPDGMVEVFCQGDTDTLERFIALLNDGPFLSRVELFETKEVEPIKTKEFKII